MAGAGYDTNSNIWPALDFPSNSCPTLAIYPLSVSRFTHN